MKKNKIFTGIVIGIIAIVLVFIIVLAMKINKTHKQKEIINDLSSGVSDLEKENSGLAETIANGEDEEYIEKVARENDYVYPEERIYYDSNATDAQ